ncbi:MAG: branched-chain amino acid ABC transporter permease [Thermomicrobiales bacterium]
MLQRSRSLATVIIAMVSILLVALPLERARDGGAVVGFLVPSLTTTAIFAIICIGLNIQWGYTGIFNFGVVAFFMIGAYTAAIFTVPPADDEFSTYVGGFGDALSVLPGLGGQEWLPFAVAVVAAAAFSAILALLLGLATLRLREDYLAIALIGIAELLRRIVIEEQGLVNGTRGLGGIPRPFAGWVSSDNYKYLYFALVLAVLALVYLMVELGLRSPWGRVLRAIREDEEAAAASGKDVFRFKLQGFVFGAALMGAGGAFYAFQQGAVTPEAFTHFFGTFIFWAMLIVGGSGNTAGAIVGAYVIWGLWSITLQIQGYDLPAFIQSRIFHIRDFFVGALIVVVLLANPRGLLPERARVSRWLDRRMEMMRRTESSKPS